MAVADIESVAANSSVFRVNSIFLPLAGVEWDFRTAFGQCGILACDAHTPFGGGRVRNA